MISFDVNPGYFVSASTALINEPVLTEDIVVKVYPAWLKEVTLQWEVPAEWIDPKFTIYKSESSQSGYKKVNTLPVTGNAWVDRETYQDSTHRVDFYIVEATLSTGEVFRSAPAYVKTRRNSHVKVYANEISRREALMLRKFLGVPAILFKRRTYGKRCPDCWSEEYASVIRDNCERCVGTGYDGGYFPGIVTYFQFEPSQKHLQFTYSGKTESNHTSCWTTSLPKLDPYDVIVRLHDYKVFNLDSVRQTELQGETLRQMAAAVELSHKAPEHKLIDIHNLMAPPYDLPGLSPMSGKDTGGTDISGE